MWGDICMKIGIIGNGVHSKRIQKILKDKKLSFFIYKPEKPKYFKEEDYIKLLKCNVIFILTPNNSHLKYIKEFYKNRYIFCEKPPVNNKKELFELKRIKSRKIYFNYNFRFTKLAELIQLRKKFNLGKLVYANIISAHALAQKKIYKFNWRSNRKYSPMGVFEIVSIHYIDMLNYLFDVLKIDKPKLSNLSKVGNSYDTSHVELKLRDKSNVNIFTTYNSAYLRSIFFLFDNGIISQNKNLIEVRGPSLNLDKNGFIKEPKLIKKYKIDDNKDYKESLKKSVTFFLKHAKNKKSFSKKSWNCSIRSNSLLV